MPTPKLKQKKRRAKLIALAERAGVITAGVVVVLAGITYIARLDALSINAATVEGDRVLESSEVVELTGRVISGSYLFLPRRNFLIYPKDDLERSIKAHFPRVREVEVERADINRLNIKIEERRPDALWCGEGPDRAGGCFYVDDEGFVFDRAPFFSGDVFFRYYGGEVNPRFPIRSKVISKEWIDSLKTLRSHIEVLGLKPISVHIKEDEFDLILEEGGFLLFNRAQSMEESLSMLANLLRGGEEELIGDDGPNFLYIDLRFGNRVFYKMKFDE